MANILFTFYLAISPTEYTYIKVTTQITHQAAKARAITIGTNKVDLTSLINIVADSIMAIANLIELKKQTMNKIVKTKIDANTIPKTK